MVQLAKKTYTFAAVKVLFIILGTFAVVLGVVGIFLPLLPTTPFLLLAATLYLRSSPRLYQLLITNKYLGEYIRQWREYKAITVRTKIVSISLMWAMMLFCICFVVEMLYLRLLLLAIAIGVTLHIASFKTLKK